MNVRLRKGHLPESSSSTNDSSPLPKHVLPPSSPHSISNNNNSNINNSSNNNNNNGHHIHNGDKAHPFPLKVYGSIWNVSTTEVYRIRNAHISKRFLPIIWIVSLIILKYVLLGYHTMRGGILGHVVDSVLIAWVFRETLQQRNEIFEKTFHLPLPKLQDRYINTRGIPVMTHPYLANTLLEVRRRQHLQEQLLHPPPCGIPSWVLQPNLGNWYRPMDDSIEATTATTTSSNNNNRMVIVDFESSEMIEFMTVHYGNRLPSINATTIPAWGLAAIYSYGGAFVHHSLRTVPAIPNDIRVWSETTNCNGNNIPLAIVRFQRKSGEFVSLQATPRHPQLQCALQQMETTQIANISIDFFLDVSKHPVTNQQQGIWLSSSCANPSTLCCELAPVQAAGKGSVYLILQDDEVETMQVNQINTGTEWRSDPRVHVTVKERPSEDRNGLDRFARKRERKQSIGSQLAAAGCEAGWLCNRCLKFALYGTFEKCSSVCRTCYQELVCNGPDVPSRTIKHIDVIVEERRPLQKNPQTNRPEKRIPRIIHQTFMEEVTPDRYPHLVRLRNSWKASGWDVRFYTDDDARAYIQENFPPRFVAVFDVLTAGAFKVGKPLGNTWMTCLREVLTQLLRT